jgi:hypothetical protein
MGKPDGFGLLGGCRTAVGDGWLALQRMVKWDGPASGAQSGARHVERNAVTDNAVPTGGMTLVGGTEVDPIRFHVKRRRCRRGK